MEALRFIVDNNVGRLARSLRLMGYDALYIDPIDDRDLVEIAREEGRIILTKDTGVLRRRLITSGEVQAVRVEDDDWRRQIVQVVDELALDPKPRFTRCLECNVPLEPRSREEAQVHVPPYVHRTQSAFLACPHCGRYYWQGTHWRRMRQSLEHMFDPDRSSGKHDSDTITRLPRQTYEPGKQDRSD